jgi:hypothetical protein
VFDKIGLILANFGRLWTANPVPVYRPAVRSKEKQAVLF